ncbi:MAG: DUF2621 family protein [Candidatus Omnitrophica bacterium]|nr:DUF2621 family protein [Candidatus Omnitrophota bacterium]
MDIKWSDKAKEHFDKVIENLPQFHRSIAEQLVKESAEELATKRNSEAVEDQDVVIAFFKEVPPAFKDMMKRLFSQQGIEYSKYIKE